MVAVRRGELTQQCLYMSTTEAVLLAVEFDDASSTTKHAHRKFGVHADADWKFSTVAYRRGGSCLRLVYHSN